MIKSDDNLIATPGETGRLLAQLQKNPRKKLGQNFLVDQDKAMKIAASALELPAAPILEIGAGLGGLSQLLRPYTEKLMLLELDHRLVLHLRALFAPDEQVQVVEANALNFDYGALAHTPGWMGYHVFGNIPYHITSELVERLLDDKSWLSMTLLIQKEAAQRLLADPGRSNSPLTLRICYHATGEILFSVPRSCFSPAPEVDSAVIRLIRRSQPLVAGEEQQLCRLINAGFSLRRKTLINALRAAGSPGATAACGVLLHACGLKPPSRAEELSLTEYAKL
ncbi:MAG: 16S rRNA (adenine(1518)-N(6)/adenine(1519)-N(6))-dimethyltransferase RsmA, partial [Clostridiales bacterium]